ncbi:MAG TPA: VF530 family protein [Candidatus Didemnitutus sp.]|nr:VF530 family protein [Candidatus Didemnitutus sp.]
MDQSPKSNDPLHGVTLKQMLIELSGRFGWKELARQIPIRCFMFDPTINSSLKFLRQTPWARAKVEEMYVAWKTSDR